MPDLAPVRQSRRGVLAVRDPERTGWPRKPWVVLYVPAGLCTPWPGQPLTDDEVALWELLLPRPETATAGVSFPPAPAAAPSAVAHG